MKTFEITRGVYSSRVKPTRARKVDVSPQRAKISYARDPSVHGKDYTVISLSLPVEQLLVLDELAAASGMARSHYVRWLVEQARKEKP